MRFARGESFRSSDWRFAQAGLIDGCMAQKNGARSAWCWQLELGPHSIIVDEVEGVAVMQTGILEPVVLVKVAMYKSPTSLTYLLVSSGTRIIVFLGHTRGMP